MFLAPTLIFFVFFFLLPVGFSLYLTFTRWNGFSPPNWIGLDNYRFILPDPGFRRSLGNTLLFACGSVFLGVPLAFAIAKYEFWGRNTIFRAVLGAQMSPFFLFLIPLFFIMRFFPLFGGNDLFGQGGNGLLGTYGAIILPFVVTYYGIFLMRQFMVSIPDALLDAGRIDGASEFRIFWSLVLPLLTPALVTLGVFVFIYQWNEFIWTVTMTRANPELQTIPVGIFLMQGAYNTPAVQSLRQAALAVSVVPLALVFLTLQRYYVRGLVMSGIKG